MSTDGGKSVSRRSRNQEVDRISDLPESVLLHILSFLSTIYIVRTSVLSRRWQYVWTGVPCLSFDSELVDELGYNENSKNFVHRFLFQYKATSISKFRIESELNDSPDTELLIRWAINRNVGELDISFDYSSSLHHLPQTIFGCRTLVVLKLKGYPVSMVFPPSACIPCLKTLELDSVSSPDDDFENKLISCCVVLESLSIFWNYGMLKSYRVHAQQLMHLKIKLYSAAYHGQNDNESIDINAPFLEDLDIEDVSGKHSLLLANLGNLRKAKISLNGSNAFQSLLKCFSALENAKCLSLSSPHIKQDSSVHEYAGNLCTKPKLVPTGLLSHLRVIVVENFSGTNDELGMLKYILKNGKVLDLVQLQYRSPIDKKYTTPFGTKAREIEQKFIAREEEGCKQELAQKILEYPRASQKCKLSWFDAKLEAS